MPEGLLLLHWNDRSGVEILDQYPETIDSKISKKSLLQVYNMHQYSREKGVAWLNLDKISFISYYSGPKSNYFVVLLLNILENPENFEKKFEQYAKILINNLNNSEKKENFSRNILQEFNLI